MAAGELACRLGRGLVAGFAGTSAMTATTALERRALGSPGPVDYDDSPVIVEQLERWTHLSVHGGEERAVNQVARFGYGSVVGLLRAGLDGRTRHPVLVLVAVTWGAEVAGLELFGLAPMPWRWPRHWLASSLVQHVVYAVATDATYRVLSGTGPGGEGR